MSDPIDANPFDVLDVAIDAPPREVERQGKKLLGLLSLGLSRAGEHPCHDGTMRPRTEDAVRWAMGELADPVKRIVWEIWATATPRPVALESRAGSPGAPLPEALRLRWWE